MKPIIARAVVVGAVLFVPLLALAQTTQSTGCTTNDICQIASTLLFLINSVLVPLLFAAAFIMFLYGIAKAYIFSGGDAATVADGHKLVLWGVIGFVVMISLWGLVNIVSNTFGLSGTFQGSLPTSPTSQTSGT
jgi:hypothetical protein